MSIPHRAKLILVNLLVLAVMLLMADVGLWALAPLSIQSVLFKIENSHIGLESEVSYWTDEQGMRTSAAPGETDPDSYRILCLGASTTESTPQNWASTWYGLIEAELRKTVDDKIRLLAFGRGGWRAPDNAAWLEDNLSKLRPDLIILLLGINDACWGHSVQATSPESAISSASIYSGFSQRASFLKRKSQLWRRLLALRRRFWLGTEDSEGRVIQFGPDAILGLHGTYLNSEEVSDLGDREPDPIITFSYALEFILELTHSKGIPAVLLGQPVLWSADPEDRLHNLSWFTFKTESGAVRAPATVKAAEMRRFNLAQMDLARKYGAAFVDLQALMSDSSDYFYDDCHFTDLGCQAVAGHVIPVLKDLISAGR